MRRFAIALLVGLALIVPESALAEELALPTEVELGVDSRIIFELDLAEIHLTSRSGELPILRARTLRSEQSATLDIASSGGSLVVRRARTAEKIDPIFIEVDLGAGRSAEVRGSELTVRIEDPPPAQEEEQTGRGSFHLVLADSDLRIDGASKPQLELTRTRAVVAHTQGKIPITMEEGSVQVSSHRGTLEIEASNAFVGVDDQLGSLTPHLEGGSLEISGGRGQLKVAAFDAELYFDSWGGQAEVRADRSLLDARNCRSARKWKVEGEELRMQLENVHVHLQVILERGGLEGNNMRGNHTVTVGDGTTVELSDMLGRLTLELSRDAEGWITALRGGLEATLLESRLTVDGVLEFALKAERSEVTASGVEQLGLFEVDSSEISLDLRKIRHDPSLDLAGLGQTSVVLPPPCIVRLADDAAAVDNRVQVTGCELRLPGQAVAKRQDRLRFGKTPRRMTITMDLEARVEVEGNP